MPPSTSCSRSCASNGTRTGEDDLRPSDIILPPADLSYAEAGADFTGEGLVLDPA